MYSSHYEKLGDSERCIDDQIPFEIPANWKWVRFSEVFLLLSGRDLPSEKYNSKNLGIPYITGASQFEAGFLYVNRWTEVPVVISHKGDFLFTCKGTIGSTAFNDIGDIHIARQVMAVSSIGKSMLKYFKICFETFLEDIKNEARSMIPGIDRETILSMLIPLPPLSEQERIVAKLNSLLSLVDNL